VVPPSDPAALAAAWARVLNLPVSERAALGERGLARVREHFAIDRIAERYAALYRELVVADA
ncbi:MAG: glycosyl transferase, partial [Proteobacteria bacterium]|nr:glycosyl transferase [Pseudomonadota bacterium]